MLDRAAASVAARPAYSDAEVYRIRRALTVIPATDRDTWLRVGCALHWLSKAEGWDEVAFAIWTEWSSTAPGKEKYDEADQIATWKSFERGYNGQKITLGTLFHLAKAHGWRPSAGFSARSVSFRWPCTSAKTLFTTTLPAWAVIPR